MKKGTFHSKETKQKMRETALKKGNKPPSRKGISISPSEEVRKKISITLTGHAVSLETRYKQRLAKLGKPISEEHRKNISIANKRDGIKPPIYYGENHPNWVGDKVGYGGLHSWIRKYLGTADTCEHCGRSGLKGRQIDWANKSQKYLRDLNDWLRLCKSCHRKYDLTYGIS